MKRINLLVISGISALILFIILTFVESKIINNESIQAVFVSKVDIPRDSKISENSLKEVFIPSSLVVNTDTIVDFSELKGKYAKEAINKGQIIFKQDIASKEELRIIETETGVEKIAVKIKAAENAISYQVKPKDRIHLYFTGKSILVDDAFLKYGINFESNKNDNSLQTAKLIEDIEILGIYDELGRSYENPNFSKLDTIVIAVQPKVAEMINNLRSQGTFDITG